MDKSSDNKADITRSESEVLAEYLEFKQLCARFAHLPIFRFPKLDEYEYATCPLCKRDFLDFDQLLECSIYWDDEKKQYCVVTTFKENLEIIQKLIRDVARASTCSCGQALVLSDYSIHMIKNDVYKFSGIYKCPKCKKPVPGVLKRIKSFFKKLHVQGKVGPVEIKYDGHLKDDDTDD